MVFQPVQVTIEKNLDIHTTMKSNNKERK